MRGEMLLPVLVSETTLEIHMLPVDLNVQQALNVLLQRLAGIWNVLIPVLDCVESMQLVVWSTTLPLALVTRDMLGIHSDHVNWFLQVSSIKILLFLNSKVFFANFYFLLQLLLLWLLMIPVILIHVDPIATLLSLMVDNVSVPAYLKWLVLLLIVDLNVPSMQIVLQTKLVSIESVKIPVKDYVESRHIVELEITYPSVFATEAFLVIHLLGAIELQVSLNIILHNFKLHIFV